MLLALLDATASGDMSTIERRAAAFSLSAATLTGAARDIIATCGNRANALQAVIALAARTTAPLSPSPTWERLCDAFDACLGRTGAWQPWVDASVQARTAGAFKLDVSFAFDGRRHARFSINDKLEPEAFRERLASNRAHLGSSREVLDEFFGLAQPGEVQTTLGLKYLANSATPDRVSLYYEELGQSARGIELRAHTFARFGLRAPDLEPDFGANAVCIDFRGGQMLGAKCYDVTVERHDTPARTLPSGLADFRDRLPFHPDTGTRRYMLARRFDHAGAWVGSKLLFMTEVHAAAHAARSFALVEQLLAGAPVHPEVQRAYESLARAPAESGRYFFPDLVGRDVTPEGRVVSHVVHVSVR
ncbi:MAG: hypothetical protein R3B13_35880 [Polyangiaceae bacterium]